MKRERESVFAEYIATDERREGFKSYRNALFIATLSSRSQKRAPPAILLFSLSLSLSYFLTITRAKGFSPRLTPPSIQRGKNTVHDCEHGVTQERK